MSPTVSSDSPLFARGEEPGRPLDRPVRTIDDSKTVRRFLPRPVKMTLPGHQTRQFQAGLQDIPEELADHPWLRDNGMLDEPARGEPLPLQPQAPVGTHGYATAFAQSGIYDATQIPDYRFTDRDIENADAQTRLAAENVRVAQENLDNALRIHQSAAAALNDARARRERQVAAMGEPEVVNGKPEVDPTIERLSKRDRARFDSLSEQEKVNYLRANEEDRARILGH